MHSIYTAELCESEREREETFVCYAHEEFVVIQVVPNGQAQSPALQ